MIFVLSIALFPISKVAAQSAESHLPTDTITSGADVIIPDSVAETAPAVHLEDVPLDTLLADSVLKSHISRRQRMKHFTPDPIRAMWLALVFPGGGQIYNRKFWKLPVIYGGFLGCTYALTWNNQMLRDYSQAYLDIMDNNPNTKSYEGMLPIGYDITGKEERFKTIFKNKKDHFRKYRDMSIFAFAGVYLISVIDAYVDAELSTFDISKDLSIRWEPAIINTAIPTMHQQKHNAYGISCNLNF